MQTRDRLGNACPREPRAVATASRRESFLQISSNSLTLGYKRVNEMRMELSEWEDKTVTCHQEMKFNLRYHCGY